MKRFANKHIETTLLTKYEDGMNLVFFKNSNLSSFIIAEISHRSEALNYHAKFTISHGNCKEINAP